RRVSSAMTVTQNDQHETQDERGGPAMHPGSATRRTIVKAALAGAAGSMVSGSIAAQETSSPTPANAGEGGEQPNILMIMADDIGYWNISAYNLGMMGYQTPNIDRIA